VRSFIQPIWVAVVAMAFCGGFRSASAQVGNQLINPGFEEGEAGTLEGWEGYGRGFTVDESEVYSGRRVMKCTARGLEDGMGAVQIIRYEKPDKRPIIVGGWSKAEKVGGGGDYSVYLDVIYEDGTPLWGKTSAWGRGTHDWEYNARIYWPAKPVREIQTFVFIRRTTGTAWFDAIKVYRGGLHLTGFQVGSDYPRRRNGRRLRAGLTQKAEWRCDLLAPQGDVLDSLDGTGDAIRWLWQQRGRVRPEFVRFVAQTGNGERVDFTGSIRLPPVPENPVKKGYAAWTETSMRKVFPTESPRIPGPPRQVNLTLARNEHEAFQIAVKPADAEPLRKVRIELGEFADREGNVFPAEHIQWHVVGYIWVETPSGHPLARHLPNWCPDALLPARPFDVTDGRTQAVWLNFFAGPDLPPGLYSGSVKVRPANAPATEIKITIRVRDFALPRTPRLKTAFAIMDGFTRRTYGKITPELRRRGLDIMLDHRLNPDDISRTEPPAIQDLLYARERGMNTFNILNLVPKPKGDPLWTCLAPLEAYGPDFNRELAARLDGYTSELRKHGLSKMAYFYGFDERREDYDELIKSICSFLKQRYPEVSTFTTAGYMYEKRKETPPDYEDHMDWYCPLTSRHDPDLSRKLRATGKQVWWYVCCGPQHPYANFASMDYPAIEGRLLAWMTYGYRVDGLLFWHVNYWGKNKIIDWQDPYLDWDPTCIARMTGDGALTYPAPGGPVSSIRLENVRDGSEDYDYLSILADLKGERAALDHFDRLVRTMTDYTRDPDELYRVRSRMADQIEAAR